MLFLNGRLILRFSQVCDDIQQQLIEMRQGFGPGLRGLYEIETGVAAGGPDQVEKSTVPMEPLALTCRQLILMRTGLCCA